MGCQPSEALKINNLEMNFSIDPSELISGKMKSIFEEYEFMGIVSRNDQSIVRKIKNKKSQTERIVKIYHRNSKTQYKALNEIKTLKSLDHANIIKLLQYFVDEKSIYLVFEKSEGISIYDGLFGIKEEIKDNFKSIFKQILKTVQYLHKRGFYHRNLTPENILIEQNKSSYFIKIIGFSHTVSSSDEIKFQNYLTDSIFQPPEKQRFTQLEKADIWMIGIILLLITSGVKAADLSYGAISKSISLCNSKELRELLKGMLDPIPVCRFSTKDCLEKQIFQSLDKKCVWKLGLAIHNMHKFSKKNALRQIFDMYCFHRFSELKDQFQFANEFGQLDINNNGIIERDQLTESLMKSYQITEEEARKCTDSIFQRMDKNNNNSIQFSQFMLCMLNWKQKQDILKRIFMEIDANGDGIIEGHELKNILKSVDINASLTYENFKQLMFE